MAKRVLKIFSTKALCFPILYELTKNECFLLSFIGGGGGGNFVCGVIRRVQFIFIDRFFIPLMVAELL